MEFGSLELGNLRFTWVLGFGIWDLRALIWDLGRHFFARLPNTLAISKSTKSA